MRRTLQSNGPRHLNNLDLEMKIPNPDLELAGEFIRDTGCNIFLTGKAGTGKTTFLQTIKENTPKRMIVTAPTGVAAINAGGVTLHSFFQLPFGPFVPGSENRHFQYRFSREKSAVIKGLDLLVIDEISMVRADLLDAVDSVLRRYRRSDLSFGGVQLLMIGDLFQLPPVVKEGEWTILKEHYDSPYFFNSRALGRTEMVTIELKHIYRQPDRHFIGLLNQVRNSMLDSSGLRELNARHVADFVPSGDDGYITLCTHNRKADTINRARLGALRQKTHSFQAEIEGDFPEHTYPTTAALELKRGAQVMFVRNDPSPLKRYFNGKIGLITRISGEDIRIKCPEDSEEIVVEPVTWENIDYILDKKTLEITENKIGTFRQYPLKLAWAITIHKSQGLTFDRAIIDAQAAFAHGQVYVALSRCRTLEGLVLSTPLVSEAMKVDSTVLRFSEEGRQNAPSADRLAAAKIGYQQQLLMDCFDFQRLRFLFHRMAALLRGNPGLIPVSGVDAILKLQEQAEEEICLVGDNFQRQLRSLFSDTVLPAADPVVLGRIAKASVYFQEKIESGLGKQISTLRIDSDNKELRQRASNALKLLREETAVKLAAVKCCKEGFSPSQYFRAVSAAEIETPGKKQEAGQAPYAEADIPHPELFRSLKEWRSRKAKEGGLAHYQVLHQKTLIQIALNLPDTLPALKQIKGIGEKLAKRYGEELVAEVGEYRRRHNIEESVLPDSEPAETQPGRPEGARIDTRQITFGLFEKGLTLSQIAEERKLALSTIEGHMAHWVETGRVDIDALLPPEKRRTIVQAIERMKGKSLSDIREAVGDGISYGEIRMVQAHLDKAGTGQD